MRVLEGRTLSSSKRPNAEAISPEATDAAGAAVGAFVVLLTKTLPTFAIPSNGVLLPFLASVPKLKRAQTPRNTMLAPRRLARELVPCVRTVLESSASSISDSPFRRLERPRASVPKSLCVVIRNEGGTGVVGVLPTLPLLPYRSVLQDTRFRLFVRPPSE